MFESFKSQQNTKLEKLIESITVIKEQNKEIQKSIEFLSERYDEVFQKMTQLEQKNKAYEIKILSLENKVEQMERSCRTTAIEIKNVPKTGIRK